MNASILQQLVSGLRDFDESAERARARLHGEKLLSEQKKIQGSGEDEKFVAAAVADTFTWVTKHTQTKNDHWREEGRPSPYEPIPAYDYLRDLFLLLDS